MKWTKNDGKSTEMKSSIEKIIVNLFSNNISESFETLNGGKFKLVSSFFIRHSVEVFNVEFELQPLNPFMASDLVERFKRADGQYTYRGDFMSREYIEEQVKQSYGILVAKFNYIESD